MEFLSAMSNAENVVKNKNQILKAMMLFDRHVQDDLKASAKINGVVAFLNCRDNVLTLGVEATTLVGLNEFLVIDVNIVATESEAKNNEMADGTPVRKYINAGGGAWWKRR
jgi:hypothetical protein